MFLDSDEFSLGDVVREVSVSGVTDAYAYDAFGRQVSHTDGRGYTSHTQYNALGLRSASIDALGNRTAYAYDRYGNVSAVTNPLGNAVVYEYDLRGRRTYEGGATYPVRYTYDVFGNKTTMTTYRNESLGPASGDVTTWRYDEASNCMTNKVYADGKGPRYGYTQDGKLSQRIWARGIVTDYSYDGWGSLTNTVYSDGTPTVTLLYDAMGRQTNAVDAAGVTTFRYDDFGSLTNETVIGAAGENTIIRHWDAYGRTAGYTLNNVRQTTIGYDAATGRIATMLANGSNVPFTWSYLPGSDLKSSLAYPNGLTASWTYDADDQLLQVRNATPADVISQYDYTYDAAGRRIEIARSGTAMSESRTDAYGYNVRNELTSATKTGGPAPGGPQSPAAEYAYQYDDIGNRITSTDLTTNRTYVANSLNQYSAITTSDLRLQTSSFEPQFDDDGNQTLIQTSTGIWSVQYNGENRPVLWTGGTQSAATNIVMSFDRMGRRVEYLETTGGSQSSATETNAYHRFVYDGYLCILRINGASNNAIDHVLGWDPSEPLATRPLVLKKNGQDSLFYTHEGKKNVSELVSFQQTNGMVAHYEYTPFGAVSFTRSNVTILGYDFMSYNTFRFSSEYYDGNVGLVYYNYRHFKPDDGRWTSREPLVELSMRHLRSIYAEGRIPNIDALTYSFVSNMAFTNYDVGGLFQSGENDGWGSGSWSRGNCWRYACNDKARFGEPHSVNPPGETFPPPGTKLPFTCESLKQGIFTKYKIGTVPQKEHCKECHYRVLVVLRPNSHYGPFADNDGLMVKLPDYHWYREDTDDNCNSMGTWSHKPGSRKVETGVIDPSLDAQNRDYDITCNFYFCFPCKKQGPAIDADK